LSTVSIRVSTRTFLFSILVLPARTLLLDIQLLIMS